MVDRSAIGRDLTTVRANVEPGRLRYFFDAVGERNPVYRDAAVAKAAGYGAIPIPPTYLFCLEMMDAEKPFEFFEPAARRYRPGSSRRATFHLSRTRGRRRHADFSFARE